MSRPIRIEYENAVYHLTSRGNERGVIYRDDQDRREYLEALAEAADRFGLLLHIYCLMPNHYHLVIQTPRANLSRAMAWFETTYCVRFNRRHRRAGHLYQGRFKAHLVEADAYAAQLILYIHLNPVRPRDKRRAIPVERRRDLARYRWSSHRSYGGHDKAPDWLCLDWLGYYGRRRREAQRHYKRHISSCFGEVVRSPFEQVRGGLVLGGAALWEKVRRLLEGSDSDTEIRWQQRRGQEQIRDTIQSLVRTQENRRVQIWLQVRLGGQQMTEVARDYGYRDGSGVLRVVQRLEARAKEDRKLAAQLRQLSRKANLSGVKR